MSGGGIGGRANDTLTTSANNIDAKTTCFTSPPWTGPTGLAFLPAAQESLT